MILYSITSHNSFANFLAVIFDLHMKYPVIIKKQLMPILPHAPNNRRKIDCAEIGDAAIGPSADANPELTT